MKVDKKVEKRERTRADDLDAMKVVQREKRLVGWKAESREIPWVSCSVVSLVEQMDNESVEKKEGLKERNWAGKKAAKKEGYLGKQKAEMKEAQ